MQRLAKKVAVITGGTSGIGLAAAKLFVEEGAHVVLFARSADGLEKAASSLGPAVVAVRGDVRRPEDIQRLFDETSKRFGRTDVLLANAATVRLAPIGEATDALFDE